MRELVHQSCLCRCQLAAAELRQPRGNAGSARFLLLAVCATLMLLLPRGVAAERHVAAAAGHICVVQDGGGVVCRGNTTSNSKLYPPIAATFHAVTVGDDFSCGLTAANSSVVCWGALPGGASQLPPTSTFFVDAHAGPRHVCGLTSNGTVLCYGDASSRGAINVPSGVVFQGVTAGTNYTCGVARNHSVVCWGDGTNPVVASVSTWRAITDAEHIAAGADHACYVRVNGSVGCWGNNTRGAAAPPAALASSGSVWWLAAGASMTCAASGPSVPGPVTCWGAVTGTIATDGYEVVCAGWGCVASTYSATGDGGSGGIVVVAAEAAGGSFSVPQIGERVVTTLAGNGVSGTADGVGTAARFRNPQGVSLDGVGGLYVADYYNCVIRRVIIATRSVTTVAGIAGTTGKAVGATPLQSTFSNPYGVEADGTGNVYVADYGNHAIRMLSGVWVAGSTTGASGSANAAVGTSATFCFPYAVRADVVGGLLYVADGYNYQVRTIVINGSHAVATLATFTTFVRDIALNTAARVMYVAVGSAVYVVSYAGASTLLVGSSTNSSYADGAGSAARFAAVCGLALDVGVGVLYVTDAGTSNRIRRVTIAGGVVSTFAGSGTIGLVDGVGTTAAFYTPWGIALNATRGTLYISDLNNHVIRQVQIQFPAPAILAAAPLPPSPLAPTQQLTAWRALGTSNNAAALPVLDARNATFSSPLGCCEHSRSQYRHSYAAAGNCNSRAARRRARCWQHQHHFLHVGAAWPAITCIGHIHCAIGRPCAACSHQPHPDHTSASTEAATNRRKLSGTGSTYVRQLRWRRWTCQPLWPPRRHAAGAATRSPADHIT